MDNIVDPIPVFFLQLFLSSIVKETSGMLQNIHKAVVSYDQVGSNAGAC